MNLRERAWKEFNKKVMKTILRKKGAQFLESLPSSAQGHSFASSNEDSGSESRGSMPAGQLTNVRNNSEVLSEAHRERKTVHFATSMDICHLKHAELEPRLQK